MPRHKSAVTVIILVVLLLSMKVAFSVDVDAAWFREQVLSLFSISPGDLRHDAL